MELDDLTTLKNKLSKLICSNLQSSALGLPRTRPKQLSIF
jgi:hypothetical protein